MYILKTLQEENVHNNSLMGLKVWWSWGSREKISKTQQVGDFSKIDPQLDESEWWWHFGPLFFLNNNSLMGLKVWWIWGSGKKKFKITAGRTVFRKSTPNLTITNGDFESNFEVLKKKIKKPLKVPSLARSVPKPLKVPTVRTAEIRQKKGVNRRVESFFLSEKNRRVESWLSETRQNSVS